MSFTNACFNKYFQCKYQYFATNAFRDILVQVCIPVFTVIFSLSAVPLPDVPFAIV